MSEISSPDTSSSSTSTPKGPGFQGERFLDKKGWREEAQGVIKEITEYVKLFDISDEVPSSNSQIFLNLVTLEDNTFTIRLNERGFSVVGEELNTSDKEGEKVYETPHSLLDNLSTGYRQAFGNHLSSQLLKLQREPDTRTQPE